MNLTPVRIRGKKRKLGAIVHSQDSSSPSSSKQLRISTPKLKKLVSSRRQHMSAMPTLQGLPQELLELIFIYSMNINLPRASPYLGRKLSSKTICMEFCMQSFFKTVDHKTNIRNRTITSDPSLQSDLLTCRFFTYPFFLKYVNKAHDAVSEMRGKAWRETGVAVPDASYFDGLWPFKFTKITFLSFAEGFRIPEKLLHGPWTTDKSFLLYVLVSLGGEIDWEASMAGEIAISGLKEAIREGDEHAVAALSVMVGWAKAITTEAIQYAVINCGCDIKILRHLLFNAQILYSSTPRSTLNLHDPILWRWTDEHPDKGVLLKDMLKKAENFSLQFYLPGETDWSRIVAFPYSGSKFDARTAFDVLTREMLTRLYINYGRRITRRRERRDMAHNGHNGAPQVPEEVE
ncbi:hypothetical protein CC78DRAFT_534890 [Lojkania enalia]|uniref:Uncharacterized protein n=1 Tax=Lojkania enalia TaxID=147567 RepID=A0A9P4K7G5_9PLEO|nr:hypothetical protein CC78DRAFT_534890 [Didymosphaeria enalia]